MNNSTGWEDTIVAVATAPGIGAIAVIRMSGNQSIKIANTLFVGKNLENEPTHTVHFGLWKQNGVLIDEVLVTIFKGNKSYTGEESVEISCHGSSFIQQEILNSCIREGARIARPGEFTQRAFLNGKLDLAQAEAVADLIAAESFVAQQTALNQMRGGFSADLNQVRDRLINFAALIELELDFSDEDVEFADRSQLNALVDEIYEKTEQLIRSFKLGNALRNGVRVAIIGKPNAGKSTLLNKLLNEERAIVSDIAGTTRDTIEETLNINGVLFRLIDTAGIRQHSVDSIENLGIERSKNNAARADIIIHLFDLLNEENFLTEEWLMPFENKILVVGNKTEDWKKNIAADAKPTYPIDIFIDAKSGMGIEELKNILYRRATDDNAVLTDTVVTNARHHEALVKLQDSLLAIRNGMQQNMSGDFLSIDIRQSLHYLGEITGQVEVDRDILGTIFGKFCIGK